MNVNECPSLERLRAGLEGSADGPALASHVEGCSSCQARLERLASEAGGLTDWIREAGQTPVVPPDPVIRMVMDGLVSVASPSRAGDRVGEYRLEQLIAEGGMGAVWRAVHTRLDKPVALKLVGQRMGRHPDAAMRFAREMRAVGRLRHPNIVLALDASEWNGIPYLAMEYVEGTDLGRRVKEVGPLSVADACESIRQAALGLQHAHEHGLVHRDVKPTNLMLATDGTVKLLDLGLVRLPGTPEGPPADSDAATDCGPELTATNVLVGTAAYMAPEQRADPRAVDARADLFALGRTLCYLLAGSPEPDQIEPVPTGLRRIVHRLLARDPNERFPSAAAVADAIRPWARGHALVGLSGNPPRQRQGPARWLAVIVAVFVTAGALVALLRPRDQSLVETAHAGRPADDLATDAPATPAAGRLGMSLAEAADLQAQWAAYLRTRRTLTNKAGMTFALIPPGELNLAVNARARITRPVWMGTTEVTRGQFRLFVAATAFQTEVEHKKNGTYLYKVPKANDPNVLISRSKRDPRHSWLNPGYERVTDDHPVTMVSWNDAVAYCQWLGESDGKKYRLPTWAEQQWAARAGETGRYPGSRAERENHQSLEKNAWTFVNSRDRPQAVGQLLPNAWGLYDVLGNADEMGFDWVSPVLGEVPTGLHLDYRGPSTGTHRVMFGGGYNNRATFESLYAKKPDEGTSEAGFRVVYEP